MRGFLFSVACGLMALCFSLESGAQEEALDFCRDKISSPGGYGSQGIAGFCEKNFNLPSPYLYKCLHSEFEGFETEQERFECGFFFENIAEYTDSSFNLSEWGTSLWGPWYNFEMDLSLRSVLIQRFEKIKQSSMSFKGNKFVFLLSPLEELKELSQGEMVKQAICKRALNFLSEEDFKKHKCESFSLPSVAQIKCLKESSSVQNISSSSCRETFENEGVGPWYDYSLPKGLTRVAIEVSMILKREERRRARGEIR